MKSTKFSKMILSLVLLVALAITSLVSASDVDVAVVDVTVPVGAVMLEPGGSAPITINMSVTGNQAGTATFEVYRNWTLSGGTFTGSNPQEFTVGPRGGGDPATTFSTTGTVTVAAGQVAGTFTLAVGAFDITNSNATGAKLAAGDPSDYDVTVTEPTPPADTTPPVITFVTRTPANVNGWNSGDVTVTWNCSDTGSGVVSSTVSQTVSTEGENQSATGTCEDNAGNTASDTVNGINIDKSAPTASASASPAPNANGWNKTNVTVSFSGNDALSGLASCSSDVVLSAEGAGQSASGTCTDNAGNVSAPAMATVSIDKTAPTVSLVGGPANGGVYYFGFVPAAPTCSASDALSGVDGSCSVSGYSTSLGSHTVTASAKDLAGNTNSASASYTVEAWTLKGFYQPVDMNGVFNIVKGGSTVPLKFEVFAGPTELTATSVVTSFVQTKVACDGSLPTDEIEVTTTGGTSLRYDATGGQFIQNWQTPKAAGTCYRVTMTTQDGSSLVAFFRLK